MKPEDQKAEKASEKPDVKPSETREPVHVGAQASVKPAPKADMEIVEACRLARSSKRSVSIVVRDPADIERVNGLMAGHDRKWIVKVNGRQEKKVLVRTL